MSGNQRETGVSGGTDYDGGETFGINRACYVILMYLE